MRKISLLITFLFLIFVVTSSYAATNGDYEYEINSDKTVSITYFNGNHKSEVKIPSKINGKTVTKITNGAFSCLPLLQKVTIPDTVTTLDGYCAPFLNCPNLKEVHIGKKVNSFSENPFQGCTKLRTITLAANHPYLEIMDNILFTKDGTLICYPGSKGNTWYEVPDGTLSIMEGAFTGNNNIEDIVIPSSITSIHKNAFYSDDGTLKKRITLHISNNEYAKQYAVTNGINYSDYSEKSLDETYPFWKLGTVDLDLGISISIP